MLLQIDLYRYTSRVGCDFGQPLAVLGLGFLRQFCGWVQGARVDGGSSLAYWSGYGAGDWRSLFRSATACVLGSDRVSVRMNASLNEEVDRLFILFHSRLLVRYGAGSGSHGRSSLAPSRKPLSMRF